MSGFHLFVAVIWALIIRKCVGFAKGAPLSIVGPLGPRWSMIFSENRYPLFRIML
jgi:hypothetical protein